LIVDTVIVEDKNGRVTPLKANNSDMVEATIGEADGGSRLRVGNCGSSSSGIGIGG